LKCPRLLLPLPAVCAEIGRRSEVGYHLPTHNIMRSRVLITGGAGFIGSHLADKLVGEGLASVLILDNMSRGRMDNLQGCRDRISLRIGDVRNRDVVAESRKSVTSSFISQPIQHN
jgi:FlaA1/EpsC-like NDP-sugar epimerase